MDYFNIAVLVTCFNRREKTVKAIQGLNTVLKAYNEECPQKIAITIFLTDDGCTDGTADAARKVAAPTPINIIQADGKAYWAGGMRLAWQAAIETGIDYDFFLLLNDDAYIQENCFHELLGAHKYALERYRKPGLYTGILCSSQDPTYITYSAMVYKKGLFAKAVMIQPNGEPQECDMTNANILLVSKDVVEKIGIIDECFIHAGGDTDYGMRAKRAGFPVLTTAGVCGICDFDHDDCEAERKKVEKMSFKERKAFVDNPVIKQYHDSIVFYKRYDKTRYIFFSLSYLLNLYWPSLYYKIYELRGH